MVDWFISWKINGRLNIPLSYSLLEEKLIWSGKKWGNFLSRVLTMLLSQLMKQLMKEKDPPVTLEPYYERECGTSTFLQKLESLLSERA